MAGWDAWAIGLQVLAFLLITVALFVQAMSKQRATRLKNSKQVEATLFIDGTSILPVKLFLPSRQFIANLAKSLNRHTQEARLFWEHEKTEFAETFDRLSDELKLHLMDMLSTELSESLECYNPQGDLAKILCPTLKQSRKLLEYSTNPPSSSTASENSRDDNGEEKNEGESVLNLVSLFDFLLKEDITNSLETRPKISVARIKIIDFGEGPDGAMILPPSSESSNEKPRDADMDRNNKDEGKEDKDEIENEDKDDDDDDDYVKVVGMSPDEKELREDTENLLKGLKILCYLLFMKQFLSRFGSHEKPPSKLWLIAKATGRSGLFSLACGVILYVIIEYNVIGSIWPQYDYTQVKDSWRPTVDSSGGEF